MNTDGYDKLLYKEICKRYKTVKEDFIRVINIRAKEIMAKYNLHDVSEPIVPYCPKISLRDHKENNITNPTVKLICPNSSDISRLSKLI